MVKPARFNAHYDVEEVKPVDGSTWKLELSGLIADKRPWTTQQLAQLPQQSMIIRHICVEGWDDIRPMVRREPAPVPGTRRRRFGARMCFFRCADDYTESLDMPSALHAQTMLAATKICRGSARGSRSDFRSACAPRSSSGSRTPSGSPEWRYNDSSRVLPEDKQGFNWFAGI